MIKKTRKRRVRASSDTTAVLPASILKLSDEVGRFIEYWGFKSILGKMWLLAFLAERPVGAIYFIKNLEVSKALVSISLRDLLQHRVLLEDSDNQYVCNLDIMTVILDVLRGRELRLLGEIKLAQEISQEVSAKRLQASGLSAQRLSDVGTMVSQAQQLLKLMIGLGTVDLQALASTLTFSTALNSSEGE